ncbi:MAG: folylpolyglutamate synthase/dihydrofolate synthase family protein [Syntrophaceae bacterium]
MAELNSLKYLESLEKSGIKLGLSAVSGLMKRLGDPQNKYKSVLIAGTNGKGSTAAMLAAILSSAGLSVGLYTSPHLSDFRERIRINSALITKKELSSLIEEVRGRVTEQVTYFEFTTALAFLYFFRKEADIAVLEVGMGGRLDATNLVNPEVSIITNISLEHREYLGSSLSQIAREKAGIIKKNGICITGAAQRDVLDVIEETCAGRKSRLLVLGRDFRVRDAGSGAFSYKGICRDFQRLRTPLLGKHQIKNAALALAAVEVLGAKGAEISDEQVSRGIENTRWEGRLEVLRERPFVIADGAHNPAGITALLKAIPANFKYRKLIFILGVLRDKNYRAMFRKIFQMADHIILTRPDTGRGLEPELFGADSPKVTMRSSPREALQMALSMAGPRDLICATGSLYLIADIRELINKDNKQE